MYCNVRVYTVITWYCTHSKICQLFTTSYDVKSHLYWMYYVVYSYRYAKLRVVNVSITLVPYVYVEDLPLVS